MTAQNPDKLTIVIVEGNFVERNILRKLLRLFLAQDLGSNFSVYTSDNGIQALGYVFITKPDLLILNSKLPEYAGIELAEFIDKNANKLENSTKLSVLITKSKEDELKLPENYLIFNKADKDFYNKIIQFIKINLVQIENLSKVKENEEVENKWVTKFGQKRVDQFQKVYLSTVLGLAKISLKSSEFEDHIIEKARLTKRPLLKIGRYFVWFLLQIFTTITASIFDLISGPGIKDENIAQEREDSYRFRIGYYPTFVTSIAAILFLVIQLGSFLLGGLALFSKNQTPSKAFASEVRWDGGGVDNNWSTAANWTGDTLPGTNDTVIFDSTSVKDSTIDTTFSVKGLFIDATYSGTITQSANLTLGSDGFTQNGGTYTSLENLSSSGLVAWWKMDEATGSVVADSSSSNNTGTAINTTVVSGYSGSARYNAAGSGGVITPATPIDMSGDWTISLWSEFPLQATSDGWRTFAAKYGGNYHHIIVDSSGNLGSYNGGFYSSGYNISSLSGWHNLIVTGSNSTGTKYYIDGNQVGTNANKTGQQLSAIGNYSNGGRQEWGKFDEVRVYNQAWNPGDVNGITILNMLTINGSFTLNNGSFVAPTVMNVTGNWYNTGSFSHNNKIVNLIGTNQSISGNTTFYNFSKIATTSDTLTFQSGSTQTITNSITLKGGIWNDYLKLRSSVAGSQWNINPQGSKDIIWVDIKDGNNVNASSISYIGNDSGNNTNMTSTFTCLDGGDHHGADWNPSTDCASSEFAGMHLNIGNLNIDSGQTASVKAHNGTYYGATSITAINTVNIQGTLNGSSKGYQGSCTTGTGEGAGIGTSCSSGSGSGAGHGGYGGSNSTSSGNIYGSTFNPTYMGSSGGGGYKSTGGSGGAAIKITGATIVIDGSILANGGAASNNWGGGGSGGSIFLSGETISGSGIITANGGNGGTSSFGAGAGGRIAIHYSNTYGFSVTPTTTPGTGGSGSAAEVGTVVILDSINNDIYIKSTQRWSSDPSKEGRELSFHNMVIQNNATLVLRGYYTDNSDGFGTILNLNSLNVETGASLVTLGYLNQCNGLGPGAGIGSCQGSGGGGGGYGGVGGNGNPNLGGSSYGSAFSPDNKLGSSGGSGYQSTGGAGGGSIVVNSNSVTVKGTLSSSGQNATGSTYGGGGSGGSIYIDTNVLDGAGTISSDGGSGGTINGGKGGGGRIYIQYNTKTSYTGNITASKGSAGIGSAGDGSILLKDKDDNDLYVLSSQTWNTQTDGNTFTYNNLIVQNNSVLFLPGYSTSNTNGIGFTFNLNNFTIEAGSEVSSNSGGYAGGNATTKNGGGPGGGTGATSASTFYGGGGSYGGTGGNSSGSVYGSATAPLDLGSGAGLSYVSGNKNGGAGGGAIKIIASNTMTIDGSLTANGETGSGSGGSGGSIYLIAGTLNGSASGKIEANGGDASANYGNGGGGRIAVYFVNSNNWSGQALTPTASAHPGTGGVAGANGTVFIGQALIPGVSSLRQYRSDCSTPISTGGFTSQSSICLGATINSNDNPDNLTVEFEIKPIGTPFTNTANAVSDPIAFTGTPVTMTLVIPNSVVIGTNYHWQMRTIGQNGLSSNWTQYGGNLESEADFGGGNPNVQFQLMSESGSESTPNKSVVVILSDSSPSSITVDYSVTGGTATLNTDYSITTPGTITFPPNTTTQTFNISIINDQIDENNETIFITLSNPTNATLGSSSVYTYTINDNDTASVSAGFSGNNFAYEASAGATGRIRLNSQPTDDVSVNITGDSQLNFSATQLTFTSANWNTYQYYNITIVDDLIAQGNRTVQITYSVSSLDPYYNNISVSASNFQILDDDTIGINLSKTSGWSLNEGSSGSFSIIMTSQPTSNVVITFASDNSRLSIRNSPITFTPANWNISQNLIFDIVVDYKYQPSQTAHITPTVSSADTTYNNFAVSNATVTVLNDDVVAINQIPTNANFNEGSSTNYSISLRSQPAADVTITLNGGANVNFSKNSLTFSPANWNNIQTTSISVPQDNVVTGTRNFVITHLVTSSDTDYNGLSVSDFAISVNDLDAPGITVTQSSGNTTVTEGGSNDTYQLVLISQPASSVNIVLARNNTNCQIDKTSLTFDGTNWDTPQTVTVSATRDYIDTGNLSCVISHEATSSDTNYNSISIANVNVVINNVDTAGFAITEIGSNATFVSEAGTTDTVSIELTSKPLFNVTINLTENLQLLTNPNYVLFTTANWNTPQIINISAVNDLIAQGDRTTQLEFVPTSSDSKYSTLSNQYVNVSITDNDSAGFTVSKQTFSFTDKTQTQNFTVKLTSKPLADVNIALQPSTNNLITLSTQNLTFTELNWNTAQTVTLGINNSVSAYSGNINLLFGINSTDLVYNALNISPSTVNINISDSSSEQSGSLVLSASSLSFSSKETKSYTIKLSTQPARSVNITITSNNSSITLNPDFVTFDNSNWNNPQTVQVTNSSNTSINANLTHTITSTDTAYSGLQAATIPVTYSIGTTVTPTPTTKNPDITPTKSRPTPTLSVPGSSTTPTPISTIIPTDTDGKPIITYDLTITAIRNGELFPGINIEIVEEKQLQTTNILGQATFKKLKQGQYTIVYEYDGKTYQRQIDLNSNQKLSIDLENIVDNTYVRPEEEKSKNFVTEELGVVGIIGTSLFTASLLLLIFPYIQNLLFSAFILEFLKSLVSIYYKNYSEVLDKDNFRTIKFAKISISDTNGKVIARTVTNWQGRYRVKLQAGTYLITIQHPEYRTEYYEMPIDQNGYLQFKFELEKSEENVIATTIQLREFKVEPRILIYSLGMILVAINAILLMSFTSWLITGIGIAIGIYIFYGKEIIHAAILLRHGKNIMN